MKILIFLTLLITGCAQAGYLTHEPEDFWVVQDKYYQIWQDGFDGVALLSGYYVDNDFYLILNINQNEWSELENDLVFFQLNEIRLETDISLVYFDKIGKLKREYYVIPLGKYDTEFFYSPEIKFRINDFDFEVPIVARDKIFESFFLY